jgi:hypothetical protein
MLSLWNNFKLNSAKSAADTPTSSFYLLHIKPQKRLGWYFNLSGVESANSFRPLTKTWLYLRNAWTMQASPFLQMRFASANAFLASLHSSVNQELVLYPIC